MTDLSILIPARNEQFLSRTIEDILAHAESDFEVIAVLDGEWAEPTIMQHPRVTVLHYPESIGQRAATNAAARIARGKYVAKCDAHCAFDQGFDVKLLADMQDDWTVVPVMRNLHVFNWVCEDGHSRYQGPSGPCTECGKPTHQDIVWIAKSNPQSTSYCFDATPHFQYFGEFKKRPEGKGDLTETMSLQGSFFMLTREKYFELDICDETFGSWGSQGIEVAVKTWLSGGKVMVNHKTWYGHCFRTQGGDFGFPYHLSGKQVDHAKKTARDIFFNNKWDKQVKPLSWLVEKFWPVPGWTADDLNRIKAENTSTSTPAVPSEPEPQHSSSPSDYGIVYYTDNRLDPNVMRAVQEQLLKATNGKRIVSVSLQPIDFAENIVLPLERGYLTMFKQILTGLEALDTEYVFFCEHDVLYHPSHFDFAPHARDKYYYNTNVWKMRMSDGHCLHYICQQTSGLCANRELLLQHYRERVRRVELEGFSRNMGFEPGTHGRPQRVDDYKAQSWQSECPNVDIRHDKNLTSSRWSKDQFRNQKYTAGWTEADEIPCWGSGVNLIRRIIDG